MILQFLQVFYTFQGLYIDIYKAGLIKGKL